MIKTYDPNIQWSHHLYEFTFQRWGYTLKVRKAVGGNCKGLVTMRAAFNSYVDELMEDQGENPTITLVTADDDLKCSPDGEDVDHWLQNMLVKIELISHTKED